VEPGEVEAVLAAHPDVARAAVVARDDGTGRTRLVGYVVPRAGAAADVAELRRWLRARLPGYMVPSALVPLDALPLSAHGKVDRRALPAPAALEPARRRDGSGAGDPAGALAEIWREVLGTPRVDAGDDFFDLGGHSLLGMQVLSRVRQRWGVELPVRALFDAPTLARAGGADRRGARGAGGAAAAAAPGAARRAAAALVRAAAALVPAPDGAAQPLLQHPRAVRLTGALDADALRRALREIVRRHEALRTTFLATADGATVQVVHPAPAEFDLPFHDLSALDPRPGRGRGAPPGRRRGRDALRPGARPDAARGAGARGGEEHLLVLNLHHVAGDGWSIGVLFRELAALYEAFAPGAPRRSPRRRCSTPTSRCGSASG
jgi:hypothetical protein